MIDVKQAYRNAKELLEGKSVLTGVLEIQSGWIFSFSLVRADGGMVSVPKLLALRSTGQAGSLFLPRYLEEICEGTKLSDQQIRELVSAAENM